MNTQDVMDKRLKKMADDFTDTLEKLSNAEARIDELQAIVDRYDPVHESLRWYWGAKQGCHDEQSRAWGEVLQRFQVAEESRRAADTQAEKEVG